MLLTDVEQAILGMGLVSIIAMLINGALCHVAISAAKHREKDQ